MAQFTLTAYPIADMRNIQAAFGSNDPAIKTKVMTRAVSAISQTANAPALSDRVADGLDQILAQPRIENYNYNLALATEMLCLTFGQDPGPDHRTTIFGYTEGCLPALQALGMNGLHHAMNTLAWGQDVALPVPITHWNDVSGQYYFDASAIGSAQAELQAIAPIDASLLRLETDQPNLFDDCEPEDLEQILRFFDKVLGHAASQGAQLAVFRHGGV